MERDNQYIIGTGQSVDVDCLLFGRIFNATACDYFRRIRADKLIRKIAVIIVLVNVFQVEVETTVNLAFTFALYAEKLRLWSGSLELLSVVSLDVVAVSADNLRFVTGILAKSANLSNERNLYFGFLFVRRHRLNGTRQLRVACCQINNLSSVFVEYHQSKSRIEIGKVYRIALVYLVFQHRFD